MSTKNRYYPFAKPPSTDSNFGLEKVNFGEFILIFFSLSIHTYAYNISTRIDTKFFMAGLASISPAILKSLPSTNS